MNKNIFILLIFVGTLIFGSIIGYTTYMRFNSDKVPELESGSAFKPGIEIPEFQLTDQFGKKVGREMFVGKHSILFFGYTRCPDICPVHLTILEKMYRDLEKENFDTLPQVIFVSVDADYDSPQTLKDYMEFFHPDFFGLSGTKEQIDLLAKKIGIYYKKEYPDPEDRETYLVAHSGDFIYISPDGLFSAILNDPENPDVHRRDYITLTDYYF